MLPPKILIVLPRNMHFGPERATSIDLCVRDFILHSRYCDSTTVLCEKIYNSFTDVNTMFFEREEKENHRTMATRLADFARAHSPHMIVVQQHLPTAAIIAEKNASIPVLLHTHGFASSKKNPLTRWYRKTQYHRLAGIITVSNACKKWFQEKWPEVKRPVYVAHNGLQIDDWSPAVQREKVVLAIGKMDPNKSIIEIAQAMVDTLKKHNGWKGKIICTTRSDYPDYPATVKQIIAENKNIELILNRPFAEVKKACEQAEIGIIASHSEACPRVVMEAFAGGLALATTQYGGLAEVAGDAALPIAQPTPTGIGEALDRMISDASLRNELANKGRNRVRSEFSIETVSSRLDAIYEEHLGEEFKHERA